MAFLETWILVVDDQFKVIGDIFPVTTSDQDNVYALAVGAKEYWAYWQHVTSLRRRRFTRRECRVTVNQGVSVSEVRS